MSAPGYHANRVGGGKNRRLDALLGSGEQSLAIRRARSGRIA
jgi:hypothetical protein